MTAEDRDPFSRMLSFLDTLKDHGIHGRVEYVGDTILVRASVPGQRWEVHFFADGHVEVERFMTSGEIAGEESLRTLIEEFGDQHAPGLVDGAATEVVEDRDREHVVLDLLGTLEDHGIDFEVGYVRDAHLVEISVPRQRWEVQFFADGRVEVERFVSTGEVSGEESMERLVEEFVRSALDSVSL